MHTKNKRSTQAYPKIGKAHSSTQEERIQITLHEIQGALNQKQKRRYFKTLNNSCRKFEPTKKCYRDTNGDILHGTRSVLNIWMHNFYEHLYLNYILESDNLKKLTRPMKDTFRNTNQGGGVQSHAGT